ncbi:rhomboid family intramembrane serine protease [Thermus scotoductus]|uniref:Rhomboid family intramembrane serine protease n=1 Tax=Thermus scotoductus TaxID=37636 RepID=A0A430S5H2_THESC|nr:rhomboid family intramembrane serine protease [Thermus scotoductus]RTG92217.1 rhomboid family intramembrane serine protease [Thermus scotoductus]RTH06166.1 rhomboid family intramembrane serine protease [Thermus scotoductus]RTH08213.1 rhomboid family intramembrane serine protease [Thermus scotoductus]RTH09219.1 rhomboid family intramembrane serine protease [Thermus scotoductus]RTH15253.1 rhomboid family intramembrane serine protease [Thermus scotoductus]
MFPLYDLNQPRRPALMVKGLVLANALVFLWQLSVGLEQSAYALGFIPSLFFADPVGESYRLFTSMFLHGSLFHILSNMWFLWVFGDNVEDRMGHGRFLLFYLLGGVAAALAQGVLTPFSPVPMIGASGAVSAVLGAYYVLFPRAYVVSVVFFLFPFFVTFPAGFYLGYWAFLQLLQGLLGLPGVAWWAHLGGFVFGVLLAPRLARRWRRW